MTYIERNQDGKIINLFGVKQTPGQEWLEDTHPDVVAFKRPPTPRTASAAGIIRALHARGMLASVDAVVAQADEITQRLWARTPTFHRDDPLLIAVAKVLDLEDQLDDLFTEANSY